jgi:Methylamine utilisation protein MauE.
MKKYVVPTYIFFATVLFTLGVCEISFPERFSWANFDFILNTFPNAWKYGLHIGIIEVAIGGLLIIPAWKINKNLTEKILEILVRLGIGGMFIFASIFKIADPKGFAVLIAQYQFLPHNIINLWALILPQFEFWFGLALIVTPFVKECTLVGFF